MNHQLKNLLITAGLLGTGYLAFNYLSQSKPNIDLKLARKITQQIKHQILIVTINFAASSKATFSKLSPDNQKQQKELIDFYTAKMSEIYEQKQKLILDKHNVSVEDFSIALKTFAKDPKIMKNQEQIIQMMSQTVQGNVPDLTVDKRAINQFSQKQLIDIYQQMNKLILSNVIIRLQQAKKKNPNFDSSNDLAFKTAVKSLNIYDLKIEFFKQKGFKEQWGCPNETFFKISEGTKLVDPDFRSEMAKYELAYETIIDIAAQNPERIDLDNFDAFYDEKVIQLEKATLLKSAISQPVADEEKNEFLEKQIKEQTQNIIPVQPDQSNEPIEHVQNVVVEHNEAEHEQENKNEHIEQNIVDLKVEKDEQIKNEQVAEQQNKTNQVNEVNEENKPEDSQTKPEDNESKPIGEAKTQNDQENL